MFGDLRRFDAEMDAPFRWMQQWLDQASPFSSRAFSPHHLSTPYGAANIRSVAADSFPAINIGRTDDAVHVYLFVPGMDPASLELSVQGNLLTISGRREDAAEPADASPTRYRQERFSGDFKRSIALPEGVDVDRARASHRHGVCEVVLPKREELKPRRIQVDALH
ncbi:MULTISPECIES: Hsp20/alpha crystallin family protein [Halomonas]|uniref:Hsp20/alpha crystallin family protein n=1 Tax=Halomonas TaxID=2745 RepID=UPI001C995B4E|nr:MULTISPECIES: Hsp20/alpha crystallin family protein [Halomonas]MBY5968272.1 Hsp20/alpha crystallin family protein [Halomonas denitrificans]MBY5983764.1 Hsp20/alpha crystallin family protein [Halomonas sp. DP5Y7-2]